MTQNTPVSPEPQKPEQGPGLPKLREEAALRLLRTACEARRFLSDPAGQDELPVRTWLWSSS
ncbi:hypothetical protein ABZV29_08620 [Streptomyces sp. NPDC005236]|uniref:hypothetical protein n=1 Tax=Streptomyces sp. NPDC005236 TaxID=3157028 RepID=UPI0033A4374F